MDTKRLILFIIFSFSILMLWDAWQREHAPLVNPQADTTTQQQAANGTVPQTAKQAEMPQDSGFH